jgi:hypothetical protein
MDASERKKGEISRAKLKRETTMAMEGQLGAEAEEHPGSRMREVKCVVW